MRGARCPQRPLLPGSVHKTLLPKRECGESQWSSWFHGIDSDDGSEFINHHPLHHCADRKITLIRGRSGKKNDGCYVSKRRDGAKVIKTYHPAATPHQRALVHPATRKRPIITMNARCKKLRLGALQRRILDLTGQLETLAQAKGRTHHTPHAETG